MQSRIVIVLISTIKSLMTIAFATAWVICISEFASIKTALEFENFYANRFQSMYSEEQTQYHLGHVHRWVHEGKLQKTALDGFDQQHPAQSQYQIQDRRLFHQRSVRISTLLLPFIPQDSCGGFEKEEHSMVMCAQSILERQP